MLAVNTYFLASHLLITVIDNDAMITIKEAEDIIDNDLLFSEIEKFNVFPRKVITESQQVEIMKGISHQSGNFAKNMA